MNRNIRAITVYILNDFKRVYNKIYSNFSVSTLKNLRAADLMIRNIKLIANFQANAFFNNNFVENSSVTASKIDITEINISTFSTRTVDSKFSILKIVFIISRKTLQAEKINQLNKSNVVSFAVNSVSFQIQFLNLDKEIFVAFIS